MLVARGAWELGKYLPTSSRSYSTTTNTTTWTAPQSGPETLPEGFQLTMLLMSGQVVNCVWRTYAPPVVRFQTPNTHPLVAL